MCDLRLQGYGQYKYTRRKYRQTVEQFLKDSKNVAKSVIYMSVCTRFINRAVWVLRHRQRCERNDYTVAGLEKFHTSVCLHASNQTVYCWAYTN